MSKTYRVLPLILAVFFCASGTSADAADAQYKTYENDRFGYSVDYPDIFDGKQEPDNGDGVEFTTESGEYGLTVWGGYNVLGQDGKALLEECKERVAHIADGSDKSGEGFYSIEYSDDGGESGVEHIFHEYGTVNGAAQAGFILKYPQDEEKRFAEIKKVMESSLKLPETESGAANSATAPDISVFTLKDGRIYKEDAEIEARAGGEVPSGVDGPIRYWSAFGAGSSDAVSENETGVWFFAKDGACLTFLPLESEYECQGIIFSPDGEKFLLESGSGMRPDMTYILYELPAMGKGAELAGLRGNAVWIDHMRFVMTRIDDIRGGSFANLGYGLRVSVVMYDAAASETVVLKESTDTRNYWLKKVIEDGEALSIIEESVKSQDDLGDEEKTEEREIRVEIPAAG
jgi:hypothetical protein